MNHADHRQFQQAILNQALEILKNSPSVLGLVLTGSYARGEQDAFSDIDLICYLRDEERSGRAELYERVARIAPTLWYLWIYDQNALYLYENGVRLDLDFCKPSDLSRAAYVMTGAVIEYDPEGILHQQLPQPYTLTPAEHPRWFEPGDQAMVDWFFWMFRQIVCWAKRGGQGGYRAFNKLVNAVDSLAQVRTRLIEMRLWTLGFQDYLPRADPECAQRMAQTYPHLQAEEIIACTKLLLAEYETICPAYCQKSGATYPAQKVAVMHRLLAEYEQLV